MRFFFLAGRVLKWLCHTCLHGSFWIPVIFKHIFNAINNRISAKTEINYIYLYLLVLRVKKIILLLDIANDHTLCQPILWFCPQIKHKRKFCSILIPVYCQKSMIYCITYKFKNYWCTNLCKQVWIEFMPFISPSIVTGLNVVILLYSHLL